MGQGGRTEEKLVERWKLILDRYQEQPHLLDPALPKLLGMSYFLISLHCVFVRLVALEEGRAGLGGGEIGPLLLGILTSSSSYHSLLI